MFVMSDAPIGKWIVYLLSTVKSNEQSKPWSAFGYNYSNIHRKIKARCLMRNAE